MLLTDRKGRNPILYAVFLTVLLVAFSLSTVDYDEVREELLQSALSVDHGFSNVPTLSQVADSAVDMSKGVLFGFPDRPQLETLYIDVEPREYRTLLNDRERAISKNILTNPTEVNATLRFNNEQLRANVRLKGDLYDHWSSKRRMSLRIEVKDDRSVLHFNEFSLQKPTSRQHPYDLTYQSLSRRAGNLASVHALVKVVFNGQAWGIMTMEESMTSEFLEKQRRKESLIVRFSDEESGVIEMTSRLEGIELYPAYRLSDDSLYVKMYEEQKYSINPLYRKWYTYISEERLAQHRRETPLYDVDAYSRALFLSAFWNDGHSLWHANSRHYFNPYTLKLEPVTTDAFIPFSIREVQSYYPRAIFNPILNNSVYNYVLSTAEFSKGLEANFATAKAAVMFAKSEFEAASSFFPLDPKDEIFLPLLGDNIQILSAQESRNELFVPREMLQVSDLSAPSAAQAKKLSDHVHVRHYENGLIEVYNLLPVPVKLSRILMGETISLDQDLLIPGYRVGEYEPVSIPTELTGKLDDLLAVETEFLGAVRTTHAHLSLATQGMHNPLMTAYDGRLPFLQMDSDGDWLWQSGSWEVTAPLMLEGDLRIEAGTSIKFSENAYLIVHGAIEAVADDEHPITLTALNDSWKGIYSFQAGRQSMFKSVAIDKYSSLEDGLLSLTGGFTFYQSDVIFENVSLSDVRGEDAINIVESHFEFDNLLVQNAASDGLDSDFSSGSIANSRFMNINGDATDFSGSQVTMENIVADRVYDKVISVGESSNVRISNGSFSDVGVGIVSKDGSTAFAEDISIDSYTLSAAMAYEKKSFYDKPTLELSRIDAVGEMAFIRQTGSFMMLDQREVAPRPVDVDALYAETVMAK